MTKEENVVRSIVGPIKRDIAPFAESIREVESVLFIRKISIDDILFTKEIYPVVARRLEKTWIAVARQVERIGNLCWDKMDDNQKKSYIGKVIRDAPAPTEMLFYLAFFCYYDKPYYKAIGEKHRFLF